MTHQRQRGPDLVDHLVDRGVRDAEQWVAGSGIDAAPYFRVFNPTTQGERFDPDGDYVRAYVPELAHIPGKHVHQPWKNQLADGSGYPYPIVSHDEERLETLARYEVVKNARSRRQSNSPTR